jgi:4-amino-4-deoxy-L-arabinose transferase-like glycosyltransferase
VPTKLPHYVLPLYPPLAMLVGFALTEGFAKSGSGRARLLDGTAKALWGAVTIALAAALIMLPPRFGTVSPATLVAAPVLK